MREVTTIVPSMRGLAYDGLYIVCRGGESVTMSREEIEGSSSFRRGERALLLEYIDEWEAQAPAVCTL